MKEFPKKTFWTIINIVIAIVLIIFIILIVKLFDRGEVLFTDDSAPDSPELLSSDPIIGAISPTVVIVYFGNFTCDACASISNSLNEILELYPNDVTLIWKDFPNNSLNSESNSAALAARCAQKQNQFWDYHDLLMSHQKEIGPELYVAISKELELNERKFNKCLSGGKTQSLINDSLTQVSELNLTTPPTLFINNKRFTGEMSQSELEKIIRDLVPLEV